MRKTILAVSCLLAVTLSNAQTPSMQWAKGMGGASSDGGGGSIVTDASGNVYTVGTFNGTADFDPGTGTTTLTTVGGNDIYISKLDASGNFVWAKQMGGTLDDEAAGLAIDTDGNLYMAGYFSGTADFDPGAGTQNLTSAGSYDVFISSMNASGSYIGAIRMGGINDDVAWSIAIDGARNIYTTGYFAGTTDFDPGAATANLTSAGSNDIFVSKLDVNANFVWAKNMGGSSSDIADFIAVDAGGNVYTTGNFDGTADFDPSASTYNLVCAGGGSDIFISKLNASGNFVWAKSIGDTQSDAGYNIVLDNLGNIYMTGIFEGAPDFDPGAGTAILTSAGNRDIFISKLDASGNYVWAKSIGGPQDEYSSGLALDTSKNIYLAGYFVGAIDFDPGAGTANLGTAGGTSFDIFISRFDNSGNYVWAKNIGGSSDEYSGGITADASNNLYLTGSYEGTTNFDLGSGTLDLTAAGTDDSYVCKINQSVATGVRQETISTHNITVYPNPSNGSFTLAASTIEQGSIELYNSLGTLVYKQKIANGLTPFDLSGQASGLYFIKVLSDTKIVFTQELIKE